MGSTPDIIAVSEIRISDNNINSCDVQFCDECENVWIETPINGKMCICAVIYRHPCQNVLSLQKELSNP